MYKKNLTDKVDIQSPKVYGGMKTDEYLALNPQGLIPMLVFPDGRSLWESDVSAFPGLLLHSFKWIPYMHRLRKRFLCKAVTVCKLRSLWEGNDKCLSTDFLPCSL